MNNYILNSEAIYTICIFISTDFSLFAKNGKPESGFIRRLHAVFQLVGSVQRRSVVWLQIVNKISDFRSCPVDKYPIEYNSESKDRRRLCLQPCPVNVEDERYVQNYRNRLGNDELLRGRV